MELILNTNELGFLPFLDTPINSIIIGLKNFCLNQPYSLSIKDLKKNIDIIKSHNKKVYLSINIFALEKDVIKFKKQALKLVDLNVDGFIVSDLGIFNVLKDLKLENKVTLDFQTYVTNNYSANSLLNLGVNKVCLSKEITLDDIKNISISTKGNVELLVQGYYPITYSKRPILSCYLNNFKLKKNSSLYYIKEETREDYYYLLENKSGLTVFNNKQYSLFCYLDELKKNKINHFRIDTLFLKENEIKEYIEYYSKAINAIENDDTNLYSALKEEFNKTFTYSTPFLHNGSFLLKEESK
jgi:putative protease